MVDIVKARERHYALIAGVRVDILIEYIKKYLWRELGGYVSAGMAMRMLAVEEWIRTFLNSSDIGKAEALLNGEIPPTNNDAKLEALAEQVAALTKALAQQAEKTTK